MAIDLEPQTKVLADLVTSVPDAQLDGPTPCEAFTVGALIDHVGTFARSFTAVANKEPIPEMTAAARVEIPSLLAGLAAAWSDPAAWEGMTSLRGTELPAPVAGTIALDELVIHGWDLAVSTGQAFDVSDEVVDALIPAVTMMAERRPGIFSPRIEVPADAPKLHTLLGITGRDPAWRP
jgi:uncharacterized protein (TIGR03086 family)